MFKIPKFNEIIFISVLEKTEETVRLDSESTLQESSSKILPSSPIPESSHPSERWESDSSVLDENRTCDDTDTHVVEEPSSVLNCDVLNTEDTSNTCEDLCKTDLSPILESDSVCRTVQDEQNVDPVYL